MRALPLFAILQGCFSYKFLVYIPTLGHSHTTFLGRIADTLFEAGHDVTLVSPLIDETLINKTGLKTAVKFIRLEQEPRTNEIMEYSRQGMFKEFWTMNANPITLYHRSMNMTLAMGYTCDSVLSNSSLIDYLAAIKFDAGIAGPFLVCGLALFDRIGIKATIGAFPGTQLESISKLIGEPFPPSYVPAMSSQDGDEMSFFGRMKNALSSAMTLFSVNSMIAGEAKYLVKNFGEQYEDYGELISNASFIFTNSNPYLNYPRPLIHKTVEIGGITVDVNDVGEIGVELDAILNERQQTVFISFGSVAKSKDMPEEWKQSIIQFCKSMPHVTFIWKYEETSKMADHLPNVHLMSWLPQNDLLADPRLSLFITHAGLGSTTEIAHFGKPAIMIPLFGDQPRNAAMLAKHGGALILQKADLASPEVLKSAVEIILDNSKYAESAEKLALLLRNQPISAKELVIKHAEFVAKFGPLPQLDPYGRQLNILQYYLVDVIAGILATSGILIVTMLFIVRCAFRLCFCSPKVKSE